MLYAVADSSMPVTAVLFFARSGLNLRKSKNIFIAGFTWSRAQFDNFSDDSAGLVLFKQLFCIDDGEVRGLAL